MGLYMNNNYQNDEAILEDDDELNHRTMEDISVAQTDNDVDEFNDVRLHGIKEIDAQESQKKINLCVPIINT